MTAPLPIAEEMGPGVVAVGAVGTSIDITAQVQKAVVAWKGNAADSKKVLTGATVGGGKTYTATIALTVFQDDLRSGGMIDFTWAHKGEEHPITFTPTNGGRSITGVITVDPIDYGGEFGAKNSSDITWDFVGDPELSDDLT